MLSILEERGFPVESLKVLAAPEEAGKTLRWRGKEYTVEPGTNDALDNLDVVLMAVDGPVSSRFTPEAVKRGAVVIDNSSAYRMDPGVPLVIPEVNPEDVKSHKGIIANPNCSTIIALVPLNPVHRRARLKRLVVSTYQAVSGAGIAGMDELTRQTQDYFANRKSTPKVFSYPIAFNLIPQIDAFEPNGYTKEEMKMVNEGRKILHAPDLRISCTCVRVPVFRSHSESITLETEQELSVGELRQLLAAAPGVKVVDDPQRLEYPTPAMASGQDLIYVGRMRKDESAANSLTFWCCGDQIRKGAATNAVQIAELLLEK
jgi:aspartate-semialdehyde dehydrogenase